MNKLKSSLSVGWGIGSGITVQELEVPPARPSVPSSQPPVLKIKPTPLKVLSIPYVGTIVPTMHVCTLHESFLFHVVVFHNHIFHNQLFIGTWIWTHRRLWKDKEQTRFNIINCIVKIMHTSLPLWSPGYRPYILYIKHICFIIYDQFCIKIFPKRHIVLHEIDFLWMFYRKQIYLPVLLAKV